VKDDDMSLKTEIIPYLDENGNVAPSVHNGVGMSDNGPMFTSEYYIMLKRNGLLTPEDKIDYEQQIRSHFYINDGVGLLQRSPGRMQQEGPDDYHGVLAAAYELNIPSLSHDILMYGIKNFFMYNNEQPGKFHRLNGEFNWEGFQLRMPQLIAMMFSGYNQTWKLIGFLASLLTVGLWVSTGDSSFVYPLILNLFLYRVWETPFYFYAAGTLTIAALRNIPVDQSDPRRMTWLLSVGTNNSFMCKIASFFWKRKLKKDYPDEMRGVAKVYYNPKGYHPFHTYWVT